MSHPIKAAGVDDLQTVAGVNGSKKLAGVDVLETVAGANVSETAGQDAGSQHAAAAYAPSDRRRYGALRDGVSSVRTRWSRGVGRPRATGPGFAGVYRGAGKAGTAGGGRGGGKPPRRRIQDRAMGVELCSDPLHHLRVAAARQPGQDP